MKILDMLVTISIVCVSCFCNADGPAFSCDSSLPIPIRRIVETQFAGWHVASAEMLTQQDRERLKPFLNENCYGAIRGNFTDDGISYALYMLKPQGNGYINQLIVLNENAGGVNHYILIPATFTASAVVVRISPANKLIVDIATGKHFFPRYDVIDVFDPDKGEIEYFWKSKKFIRIISSE